MKYPVSDSAVMLHNGKFTDGDPTQGIPPSLDRAKEMNAVYDEIIAVIEDEGLTPDEAVLTQLRDAINAKISAEANARSSADSSLQDDIDAEASARSSADSSLQDDIDAEASARSSADDTLQGNIDAEASARSSADAELQEQVDDLDSGLALISSQVMGRYNRTTPVSSSWAYFVRNPGQTNQQRYRFNVTWQQTGIYRFDFQKEVDGTWTAWDAKYLALNITMAPFAASDEYIPSFESYNTNDTYLTLEIRTENESLNNCGFFFCGGYCEVIN